MPTTLWLIQAAQEQVHLMVVASYLWIGPSPTNVTLALVDYRLRFSCHRAVSLLQDRLIIPHAREIILLRTLTERFNAQGEMIGSSRAPSIPTSNIRPGESFEYDYYAKGHLPSVVNITVEIEHVINSDSKKFFPELNQKIPKPAAR
jgi:hypothetical protein